MLSTHESLPHGAWFIANHDMNYTFVYTMGSDQCLLIHFEHLPTFLGIDLNWIPRPCVQTDGVIHECKQVNVKDLPAEMVSKLVYVPNGTRYGMYMVKDHTIKFVREFWNVPRAEYTDNPYMRDIRSSEETYMITV